MKILLNRNYRPQRIETPSHPGGVSKEALERQHKRNKDKERGVYVSSKEKDRKDKKDKDRRRERHKDYYRDKDRCKYNVFH